MDNIEESDKRLNKFNKMIELWNIIYTFSPKDAPLIVQENKIKSKSKKITSTFCFLGGGIKLELYEKLKFHDYLMIEINFPQNICFEFNKDLILLNLITDDYCFKLYFTDFIKKVEKDEFPERMRISFIQHTINFILY